MAVRKINVALGSRSYSIHIGPGALSRGGELAGGLGDVSRFVVVTNPAVYKLYGRALLDGLERDAGTGIPHTVIKIPDGEEYKTLITVEQIYDDILDLGADRSVVVVALGGGVVGDIAGYAAATVMRGVRLVMVPTTLLAQVDSSVGGKTGVNRAQGKNLVGAFHQPALVIADPEALATLDSRQYSAGLAEVVKYGVILDSSLFRLLEENTDAVVGRDTDILTEVVARCCELKAQVVEKDEREAGLRRILNFGHTIGHAIEKVSGYSRYLHGEAVAMGMSAAMQISLGLGACEEDAVARVNQLLERLGLPVTIPYDVAARHLEEAIGFDKKVQRDQVAFIVAEGIGKCRQEMLAPADIAAAVPGGGTT